MARRNSLSPALKSQSKPSRQKASELCASLRPSSNCKAFIAAAFALGSASLGVITAYCQSPNNNGSFRVPTFIPVAQTPLVVVVSDFNKDGKQDLAVSNFAGGLVSELLGNGDGTFQAPHQFKVGSSADGLTVAD